MKNSTRKQGEEKEFYLVEEVAEKLRVSKMTVYRYIKASKLNAYKIGKEFRIRKSDLDSFLSQVSTQ